MKIKIKLTLEEFMYLSNILKNTESKELARENIIHNFIADYWNNNLVKYFDKANKLAENKKYGKNTDINITFTIGEAQIIYFRIIEIDNIVSNFITRSIIGKFDQKLKTIYTVIGENIYPLPK